MKIYGYNNSEIKFEKESDAFTISNDGKETKGQLHVDRGPLSQLTGFVRKTMSPYSWKPVFVVDQKGKTSEALLYYPSQQGGSSTLHRLKGESLFWAEVMGEGKMEQIEGREFLIQKNKHFLPKPMGVATGSSLEIRESRDGYIPLFREKGLIDKIKMVFKKLFGMTSMIKVKVPSKQEAFWIHPMDYQIACDILKVKLEHDPKDQEKIDKVYLARNSTDVNFIVAR